MASEVDICNRALQHLGAKRIVSLTQDTANARSCNVCYSTLRDAELETHPWNFAVKLAALPADTVGPAWGRTNSFTLPGDFLRLIPSYPPNTVNYAGYAVYDFQADGAWNIENGKIVTNDPAPLYIRYIARITDTNKMPTLFREALSARMAAEMCEEITQSNAKQATMLGVYKDKISEAKRQNAIQTFPQTNDTDEWISVRR